jgi:hypothetical protein
MKRRINLIILSTLMLAAILSACGLPVQSDPGTSQTLAALAFTQTAIAAEAEPEMATEEPVMETTADVSAEATLEPTEEPVVITHQIVPTNPGYITKWFYDTDSSSNAAAGGVTGGDDYVANLFERPFTEADMVYRPDLDITKTEISSDANFIFVNLILSGEHPDGGLPGTYGVELDFDRDGRGDILVLAANPQQGDWAIDGVSVFRDANNDVGGTNIIRPDGSYSGDSYETPLLSPDVLDDPDLAWSRLTPGTDPIVTLAFKKSLMESATFVWGVWAAESLLTPENLNLHDRIAQSAAGSPYPSHADYPLADLNLVDNTCRETYGFDATSPIPGLCYVPEPQPTATPTIAPATIGGNVIYDGNTNNVWDDGEVLFSYGVTVTIHKDSCANPQISSSANPSFTFGNLEPGTYCVKAAAPGFFGSAGLPNPTTVTVGSGETKSVLFGFYVIN